MPNGASCFLNRVRLFRQGMLCLGGVFDGDLGDGGNSVLKDMGGCIRNPVAIQELLSRPSFVIIVHSLRNCLCIPFLSPCDGSMRFNLFLFVKVVHHDLKVFWPLCLFWTFVCF